GQKIANLRQRWGVDKLNIVAHSKGGLDSREYIEGHPDVSALLQIGTPNAGSPLADAAQAGSVSLLGFIPTAIIDSLAGAASYQLTTPYMSIYNALHGHNANTQYVSLAGDYHFSSSIVDWLVNAFYGGNNDTIVPVWSVHALGYSQHLIYTSSGAN